MTSSAISYRTRGACCPCSASLTCGVLLELIAFSKLISDMEKNLVQRAANRLPGSPCPRLPACVDLMKSTLAMKCASVQPPHAGWASTSHGASAPGASTPCQPHEFVRAAACLSKEKCHGPRSWSGAGPVEFKGIQLNTHYFWHKTLYMCCIPCI